MLYTGMIEAFIIVFILSAVGSLVLNMVFRFFGKKGYLGNLYPNVRGGIPRAIGLVPFIILCFFFLPEYNTLVLIMGHAQTRQNRNQEQINQYNNIKN